MRSFLTMMAAVVAASILSAGGASSQDRPLSFKEKLERAMGIMDPQTAAQVKYDRAVAGYRNCIAANPTNLNACEGQRRIMESAQKVLSSSFQPSTNVIVQGR